MLHFPLNLQFWCIKQGVGGGRNEENGGNLGDVERNQKTQGEADVDLGQERGGARLARQGLARAHPT